MDVDERVPCWIAEAQVLYSIIATSFQYPETPEENTDCALGWILKCQGGSRVLRVKFLYVPEKSALPLKYLWECHFLVIP
jgi:hypothetical protein